MFVKKQQHKKIFKSCAPVILATQEAEIRRLTV
jgi:hypothetical protein